jgi:hypothetical protein
VRFSGHEFRGKMKGNQWQLTRVTSKDRFCCPAGLGGKANLEEEEKWGRKRRGKFSFILIYILQLLLDNKK